MYEATIQVGGRLIFLFILIDSEPRMQDKVGIKIEENDMSLSIYDFFFQNILAVESLFSPLKQNTKVAPLIFKPIN